MTLLAVAFGLLHDLFSSAMCKEYFTVHHPKIIESDHWLAMALLWGVIATWWVGTVGGAFLAVCTQVGRAPAVDAGTVVSLAAKCAAAVLLLAPLTWLAVYAFGLNVLKSNHGTRTTEHDVRLMASAIMHAQSYLLSALVFLVLGAWFVYKRYKVGRR